MYKSIKGQDFYRAKVKAEAKARRKIPTDVKIKGLMGGLGIYGLYSYTQNADEDRVLELLTEVAHYHRTHNSQMRHLYIDQLAAEIMQENGLTKKAAVGAIYLGIDK